jgi:hypothetical protein
MLTVGGMVETARYPHTAKILQFGGRFDSEGVDLARIHIPQLSLSDSVVKRGCFCGAYRQVWRLSEVAGVRLIGKVCGYLCCCQ